MGGAVYKSDSDGDLNLLGVNRNDNGRWLNTYNGNPGNRWNREIAFMFLVPATRFIPLPIYGESFVSPLEVPSNGVLSVVRSNRRASCRFHLSSSTMQYTSCCPVILFPTKSSEVF